MDDDEPIGTEIQQEIGEAVTAVLARRGEFASKWVALVETVDRSGERGLWTCTSNNVKSWDTKGLLAEALDIQAAATIWRERPED